jgi:hypothetical protein
MKDFDNKKPDAPQDTAPAINKRQKSAHSAAADPSPSVGEIASHANQEADVLRAPELSHPANATPLADLLGRLQHSHGNSYVQRVVADMSETRPGAEAQSNDQPQGLDARVRSEMESAFGENFGDVRVHTGRKAEKVTEDLNARAVTRGRDVYFGRGEYNPVTLSGKGVLAHELTQANRAGNPAKSSPEAAEAEAHEQARRVVAGGHAQVKETADTALAYRIGPDPHLPPSLQPSQPAPPAAQPAPPRPQMGQNVAFDFTNTPEIQTAFSRYLNEPAFEAEQIELYIAPEYDRGRVIINTLIQRFPAAYQDVIRQRPANVDESAFLRGVGNLLWGFVRAPFLQVMDHRYRTNPAFRRRVDRARRAHERPLVIPPDAQLV